MPFDFFTTAPGFVAMVTSIVDCHWSTSNPWLEANTDALRQDRVPVARRQSGGGAVYHVRA